LTAYVAFLYSILILFFSAFPYIYRTLRHWSLGNSGLPFIGLIIGLLCSIPLSAIANRPYKQMVMRGEKPPPEARLYFGMLGAILAPISMFWLGWTANASVPWPAPVVAGGFFATSQIALTMSSLTYLADVYQFNTGAAYQAMKCVRCSWIVQP
jgi:DHA1 family multidrug resistance protein-like MFS transporter